MVIRSEKDISELIGKQRRFFAEEKTRPAVNRINNLKRLKIAINRFEKELYQAFWKDLRKPEEEAFLTEVGLVLRELNFHVKFLKRWYRKRRVPSPLYLFPSISYLRPEPMGVALIVAPWNYPFQLLFNPLIGAISSGCCAVLKTSPHTPTVAGVMGKIIDSAFDEDYIALLHGGREINALLFKARFDLIFFTGSTRIGRIAMREAAENLTPVILELGGKSPCIVDREADIEIAARRIAWGKCINAGQSCIAPDYLIVERSIKAEFLIKLKASINDLYGDTRSSPYYGRIVNAKAVSRLTGLMDSKNIVWGGKIDADDRYIEPTILDNVKPDDPVMKEEIFGPILPVLEFCEINEAINLINKGEKPLAVYYFGKRKNARYPLSRIPSGGACVNDTLVHIANNRLPYGGVGHSGFGKYHGKATFDAFSHERSFVETPTWIDLPFRYAPFRFYDFVKRLF